MERAFCFTYKEEERQEKMRQNKKASVSKNRSTNCESCVNYVYDEDYEYYVCEANLDEDDMMRFLTSQTFSCPYYQSDDEYRVVRHQM